MQCDRCRRRCPFGFRLQIQDRPAALPVGGDGDRSGVGDDGCDGGSTFGALAASSTLLNAPQNRLAP